MVKQDSTWMSSTSSPETFFNGQFSKSYSGLSSQETSNDLPEQEAELVASVKNKRLIPIFTAGTGMLLALASPVPVEADFGWVEPDVETTSVYYLTPTLMSIADRYLGMMGALEASIPWLSDFYACSAQAATASDIYPLVSGVSALFRKKEYNTVDRLLSEVNLEKLSPTAMVTLVRTTFPARDKLESWNKTVVTIKDQLDSKGLDSANLLRGLV